MKKSPGSPFRQAHCAILCSTSRALSCMTTFPDRGFTRSYISPFRAAFMNVSVTATLMLKLVISFVSVLQVMNSRMSGWSTRRMPMLAPRRVPPCLMCSVDWLYTFMNDTGHIKQGGDRKSTRLNSSHDQISYAVFCLKKQTGTHVDRCALRPALRAGANSKIIVDGGRVAGRILRLSAPHPAARPLHRADSQDRAAQKQ